MTCEQYLDALNEAIDQGRLPLESTPHLSKCQDCRRRHSAARSLLIAYPAAAPAELGEQTYRLVRADRRQRALRGYALTATALAAMMFAAVWWAGSAAPPTAREVVAFPSLEHRLDEAKTVVLAMTDRAKGVIPRPQLPDLSIGPWLEPAANSINDTRRGLAEGLEPVTSSAMRAASKLWHDLPVTD